MPVYLQALRGRSALQTGLILLPIALTSGVITPIAGRLYDRIGPRVLVVTGFLILLINTWQLSLIEADTSIGWIMFLLALRGAALGFTIQTTFATALAAVPRPALARGSSLINGTRFVVQSIGVAVLATVLASSLSATTKAFSQQAQEQISAGAQAPFGLCETPGVPADQNIPAGVPAAAMQQLHQHIKKSCVDYLLVFENTNNLTFYVALVAIVIGLFMPGWPAAWAGRTAAGEAPAPATH
jgi:DHA2 family multidrug resistance protein